MRDARELRAAQRAAALALEELSSSSLAATPGVGLPALLRRCFRLLPYLDSDGRLAALCRRRLFRSLRGVLSRDPSPSLLPAIEVFIDNLVFSGELRNCFARRDRAERNQSRRLFTVAQPFRDEFNTVLELVCNHFISASGDEGGFWAFLDALSWPGNGLQGAPEISCRQALSLISITDSFSMPGVVQAHQLLLASRCVSGPDLLLHLPAFEHFMDLYEDYLPALGVFNRSSGVKNRPCSLAVKRPLIYCIKEATHQKLENQVNGLLSFCQAHAGDDLPISESDIYAISDQLVEKNQHLLHGKFRQEAILVMMSILSKVTRCAKQREVHESDAKVTEEVICLAAVLRLMGSLFLQILHHFSQMRAADNNDRRRDFSTLCDTIRMLSHYEANELHRFDFMGTTGQPVDRERASIQMLAHFASLSVFCVRRRLGFLWRVCIIMMMMAMNLVILEEDSMDIFQLLVDASKESAIIPDTDSDNITSALTPCTDKGNLQMKVYVRRSSAKVIASRLGALQSCSVEKVDGRPFLQSHPDYKPSWNDLTEFLECEKDRDYLNWLNQLKKFKSFKIQKYISKKSSMKKMVTKDTPRLTLW